MVAYGIAKARAMANRTDWNERTEITKAVITWFDADYEYELEIENEHRMDNEEFTAWVEENAESLAKADAEENGVGFSAKWAYRRNWLIRFHGGTPPVR